jgi:hypothetical protein
MGEFAESMKAERLEGILCECFAGWVGLADVFDDGY